MRRWVEINEPLSEGTEMLSQQIIDTYAAILKEELVPAMGCTEPIAVAYAGALARKTLGALPDTVELIVSGNIIKNVKRCYRPPHKGTQRLADCHSGRYLLRQCGKRA